MSVRLSKFVARERVPADAESVELVMNMFEAARKIKVPTPEDKIAARRKVLAQESNSRISDLAPTKNPLVDMFFDPAFSAAKLQALLGRYKLAINTPNETGTTPLMAALTRPGDYFIHLLFMNGAVVDARFMEFVRQHHSRKLRYVLDVMATGNAKTKLPSN